MRDALWLEWRIALRRLRRSTWTSAAVTAILAFGIASTGAMFSALNAVSLRLIESKEPEKLVSITARSPEGQTRPIPIELINAFDDQDAPIENVCAYSGGALISVAVAGATTLANTVSVSGKCFELFGVQPALGRLIGPQDIPNGQAAQHVAVVGNRFWERILNRDVNALHMRLQAEGIEPAVIGVTPKEFVGLHVDTGVDLFVPIETVTRTRSGPAVTTYILGRIKTGASFDHVRAWIETRWAQQARANRDARGFEILQRPPTVESASRGISFFRQRFESAAVFAVGLTAVLFLLAALNLVSFLWVRAHEDAGELALRTALGAPTSRLVLQTGLQGLTITTAATILAIPLTTALASVIDNALPVAAAERILNLKPDSRVTAVVVSLGLLVGTLITLLTSALAVANSRRARPGADRTVVSQRKRFVRYTLAGQIGVSVVLLTAAASLFRTVASYSNPTLNVDAARVVVVRALPVPNGYTGINNATYYPALLEQLRQLPGVNAVGYSRVFPRMVVAPPMESVQVTGEVTERTRAALEVVSPGYFEALRVPITDGRSFRWSDDENAERVAIVNRTIARQFGEQRIIGLKISFGSAPQHRDVRIVGVVENLGLGDPRSVQLPVFYRPPLQVGRAANYPNYVIVSDRRPSDLAPHVRRIVGQGGREYAQEVEQLSTVFNRALSAERLSLLLATILASLCVSTSFAGVFFQLRQSIERRRREMGVRLALGADRGQVRVLVIKESLAIVLSGLVVGLPVSYAAVLMIQGRAVHMDPIDAPSLLGIVGVFVVLGCLVSILPAHRAANTRVMDALRSE